MPSSPASEPEPADERDLGAELAQMEDRFKRAAADLDNYRKRVGRDIERLVLARRIETVRTAATPFRPLLPVMAAIMALTQAVVRSLSDVTEVAPPRR